MENECRVIRGGSITSRDVRYPKFATNITGNTRKSSVQFCYRCYTARKNALIHLFVFHHERTHVRPPSPRWACAVVDSSVLNKIKHTLDRSSYPSMFLGALQHTPGLLVRFEWVSNIFSWRRSRTGDAMPICVAVRNIVSHHFKIALLVTPLSVTVPGFKKMLLSWSYIRVYIVCGWK